jgi:lipopolysaccharide/colanic/teichoic acid biosynthesis glycosyltransferase
MLKRLFDIVVASIILLVFFPVFVFLAILIKIKLGSPVLFCQTRPGLNGIPFKIFKFRTMQDVADSDGKLLSDKSRLTPFGQMLRATSLDEQPELWNVLKGEMSLVGPRPLLMEYLTLYNKEQNCRHEVRPGITGWAQINGRNAISWEEKFKLDIWYVENQSFWLDLKILFKTASKVFIREGISAEEDVTMPRFTGSPKKDEV